MRVNIKCLGSLLLILASALFVTRDAQAYAFTGYKYDHTCLTHNDERIGKALELWGERTVISNCGSSDDTPDIILTVLDPWPFGWRTAGAAVFTKVGAGNTMLECTVYMPWWYQDVIGIIVHEVGHCIGLEHTDVPNQTMNPYCCAPVGVDDVAGAEAIYGPKEYGRTIWRRVEIAPGVSVDYEVSYSIHTAVLAQD